MDNERLENKDKDKNEALLLLRGFAVFLQHYPTFVALLGSRFLCRRC